MSQKFYHTDGHESWNNVEKAYLDSGHVWEEEHGFINICAHEDGHHNGPRCVLCGYDPCWHCEPVPQKCTSNAEVSG